MVNKLLRDRIVVGIRDEPTRRRLLQQKQLSLSEAIDMYKASEATSRRLCEMGRATSTAEVDALKQSSFSSSKGRRSRSGNRAKTHRDPSS